MVGKITNISCLTLNEQNEEDAAYVHWLPGGLLELISRLLNGLYIAVRPWEGWVWRYINR